MANNLIILLAAIEGNAMIQYPSKQEEIFLSLFGKFSAQNALICGLVKQETPKRRRPTTNTKNRKKTTNTFFFTINGKSKVVCKN